MLQDLRYALRSLRTQPAFTAAVVLTLALGIGANAAVFDVLDRLLLRPPAHVQDADHVVRVHFTQKSHAFGTYTSAGTTWGVYSDLGEGTRSFANLAAVWQSQISVGRGQEADRARASLVSHTYFPLLGVSPALGRFFAAEEDRVSAEPVVVLSYGYWRRRFGGDPNVLGRQLWLGSDPYAVIGIAPRGFTGVSLENVDLWLPIQRANALVFGRNILSDPVSARGSFWLWIIGRLQEGVSRDIAELEATEVFRRAITGRPGADPSAIVELGPVQEARSAPDQTAKISTWLAAVAAIVFLIACANAANLMLTAAVRRRHDIAVRLALGGGRGRLLRQLFVENLCLALVAGAVALVVAMWTAPLLRTFLLPTLPPPDAVLDVRVFAATVAATLAAGLLSGVLPAWQGSRVDLVSTLKSESRGGKQRSLLRAGLLLVQVALTLVLVAGAGLFVRSLRNVRALDLGLDAERVLIATMDLREAGRTSEETSDLFLRMARRLGRIPGVERVAAAAGNPFGSHTAMSVSVPGVDSVPQLGSGGPYYSIVTPGYFETIGTEIVRGRGFTQADGAGSPWAVVISATLARLVWPNQDPVGKCVKLGSAAQCYQVVGVAEDARRWRAVEEPHMHIYVPMGQWPGETITALFVRGRDNPESLIAPVRREMQGIEPDLPFANVLVLQDLVDPTVRPWQLGAVLFTLFGALALAVAAVGLYGVLSHLVAQRTHEIGVRMALGANADSVLRLIVGEGVRMTLVGLAVGLVGAYAAGRALKALLYGVSPADPATLVTVTFVLLGTAAVASYLPARRAAKVDPMVALRYE